MVTEKQLANLKKGKKTQFKSGDKVAKIAQSKGGINSGISKRRKRKLAEYAEIFGSLQVSEKEKATLTEAGIDVDDMTNDMALIRGQYASAKRGNSNSARFLAELREELKQQQTNVTVNNNTDPFASFTDDELRSAIKVLMAKA